VLVLDVGNLRKVYASDVVAVDRVSFGVARNEIVGLLGPNGAGKTTTINMILGVLTPTSGSILIDGIDIARDRRHALERTNFAAVYAVLPGNLTVEENLRVGGLWRHGQAGRTAALADAYRRFPVLAAARSRSAATLSGGERQILVIARALMASPRVLLLDEPSLGLAPRIVAQVMNLIQRLRDESGLTVVLVEQNARSALAIADTGVVLNVGRVVAVEDAAVLAADEALRKHYLGF